MTQLLHPPGGTSGPGNADDAEIRVAIRLNVVETLTYEDPGTTETAGAIDKYLWFVEAHTRMGTQIAPRPMTDATIKPASGADIA